MIAKARLFLNADKTKLVRENTEEAAFLYASPGDEIPESAAEMFGLVDGDLPKAKKEKSADAGADKGTKTGANKGAKAGANKGTKAGADKSGEGDANAASGAQ
jgi:hypothetical protein